MTIKEETLEKRVLDIDELEKKLLECERAKEALDIKKQGVERAFEMALRREYSLFLFSLPLPDLAGDMLDRLLSTAYPLVGYDDILG